VRSKAGLGRVQRVKSLETRRSTGFFLTPLCFRYIDFGAQISSSAVAKFFLSDANYA
jgi:hypothetical protein